MNVDDDTARQRWRQLRELFELALEQPASEREQFLTAIFEARQIDAATQQELRDMLAADRAEPTDPERVDAVAPDLLQDLHQRGLLDQQQQLGGVRFGAWILREPIGQGGMGTVWRAERAEGDFPLQGALKLVRHGWDSLTLRERFRRERSILAGLRHPNIAALLDGGETDNGQPWLVMEYVPGRALLTHCDEEALDVRARLELFLSICAAVAHAHRNLVVHRDLKPSNILVDVEGRIKLLDFGIARLLDSELAQTGTGQRLFTPEYAAPEQVRGDPVTTSVDVHALGLLLYGLLTGLRPWGQSGSTPAAYEHAILRVEATQPSRALLADPASAARSRERGGLSPTRLSALLKGDLDAIVMKALRKLPEERYASVDELADDVRRHLRAEPVLARRGNRRYRARRFLRRHALASALSAVALLSLLIGLGAALHQADRAESARQQTLQALQQAERESRRAEVVAKFMTDSFRLADPGRANQAEPSAKDLLDRGLAELDQRRDLDADTRAALLLAIGSAWNGLRDISRALPLFEQALIAARESGDQGMVVRAMIAVGTAHLNTRQSEAALDWLNQARRMVDSGAPIDADTRRVLDLNTAATLTQQERHAEAAAMLENAWNQARATQGDHSAAAMNLVNMLVNVLARSGEKERAYALGAEAHQIALMTPDLPADLRYRLHQAHAVALLYKGTREAGREAETVLQESLQIIESLYGTGSIRSQNAIANLATALMLQERLPEAIAMQRRSLQIVFDSLPPTDARVLDEHLKVAWMLMLNGEYLEARDSIARQVARWDSSLADTAPRDALHYSAWFHLALAHEQLDELAEAEARLRQAEAALEPGVLPARPWWQAEVEILRWRLILRTSPAVDDCTRGDPMLARPEAKRRQRAELHALAALCHHRADEPALARAHLRELETLPAPRSEYLRRELPALRAALNFRRSSEPE